MQAYHGGGKWACRGWPGPTDPAIQIRVSDLLQVTFTTQLVDGSKSSHWLDLFHSTSDVMQPLKHSRTEQFNSLRLLQEYQHHSPPTLMANSWGTDSSNRRSLPLPSTSSGLLSQYKHYTTALTPRESQTYFDYLMPQNSVPILPSNQNYGNYNRTR